MISRFLPISACVAVAVNLDARGFHEARDAALARAREAARASPLTARPMLAIEIALVRRGQSLRPRMRALFRPLRNVLRPLYRTLFPRSVRKHFTDIYQRNTFGGRESRSGEGSTLEQTAVIREEIPRLLRELRAKTFLDAPCGDLNWMQLVDLPVEKYYGVDIVEELIAADRDRFASRCASSKRDLARPCPLPTWSSADRLAPELRRAGSRNFKRSGCKYLLTTTFTAGWPTSISLRRCLAHAEPGAALASPKLWVIEGNAPRAAERMPTNASAFGGFPMWPSTKTTQPTTGARADARPQCTRWPGEVMHPETPPERLVADPPLVSIVTPVYNGGKFIVETVESVLPALPALAVPSAG
jgi:hypothetical protein